MNWFNIVVVLVAQAVLFWFISQMYSKTSRFFSFFKGFFLVMALLNIVILMFLALAIGLGDSFTWFNQNFASIIIVFQLLVLTIIMISYAVHYILESVESAKKV